MPYAIVEHSAYTPCSPSETAIIQLDPRISLDFQSIWGAENSCSGRFLDSRRLPGRSGEVQGRLRNSGIAPEFLIRMVS